MYAQPSRFSFASSIDLALPRPFTYVRSGRGWPDGRSFIIYFFVFEARRVGRVRCLFLFVLRIYATFALDLFWRCRFWITQHSLWFVENGYGLLGVVVVFSIIFLNSGLKWRNIDLCQNETTLSDINFEKFGKIFWFLVNLPLEITYVSN